LKSHDLLMIIGVIAFIFLIIEKGLQWAVDYTLMFFISITLFNWIEKRFGGSKKNEQL